MRPRSSFCLPSFVFFSLTSVTIASPLHAVSDLKCQCISSSPSSNPGPCSSVPQSQHLGWLAAQTLASKHQIKIQYAGLSTVSEVLDIERPLPTSVLLHMSDREPFSIHHAASNEAVSKIICGIDDEVRQRWRKLSEVDASKSDWFVLQVTAAFVVLIVLYAVGEVVWTWMDRKFFPKEAPIRLTGEEKTLTAGDEPETCQTLEPEKKAFSVLRIPPSSTYADFS